MLLSNQAMEYINLFLKIKNGMTFESLRLGYILMGYIIMNYFKKLKIYIPLFFLTGFLFYSCERIDMDQDLNVQIGEDYQVKRNLSFRIDSINDYRCPINANCIWGGDVDLFFSITEGSHKTDTLIRLDDPETNPFEFGSYQWEILYVNPYPELDKEVNIDDISIVMKLSNSN